MPQPVYRGDRDPVSKESPHITWGHLFGRTPPLKYIDAILHHLDGSREEVKLIYQPKYGENAPAIIVRIKPNSGRAFHCIGPCDNGTRFEYQEKHTTFI